MLTIANVRRAASEMLASGIGVTIARLAKKLGHTGYEIERFLCCRGYLRSELSICADLKFPGLVSMQAADNIRRRGELVTIRTLAAERGFSRNSIRMTLSRYPDLRSRLGLMSEHAARRQVRQNKYALVALVLRQNGGRRTKTRLAEECGISRQVLHCDFKDIPELENLLVI